MWRAFRAIFMRDLRLYFRRPGDIILVLGFFLMTASLFPLGIGPDPDLLSKIAFGLIWVLSLLSVLLSLEKLYQKDFEDGSLALFRLSPQPVSILVFAKVLVHWLTTGVPLILISPIIALMMHMPPRMYEPLILGLLLGTPSLSLIGSMGAALSLGARQGGLLMILIGIPFYIPVLIFGVLSLHGAGSSVLHNFELLMLGGILFFSLALAPLVAAVSIRHALE